MADFWDEIARLKDRKASKLETALSPRQTRNAYAEFDKKMEALFKKNRAILPKVNNRPITYDPNKADQYGWRPGKSRKDFLVHQGRVYDQSQQQTVAAAEDVGVKIDAGHTMALGGMEISEAERQKWNIPKDEVELSEDGNSWILRGTNSASNLAIEIAKSNRAKGKLSARNIKDIMQINTAFTKSMSLAEYNLGDDRTFRQNTDYSRAIRSLMSHNPDIDINELISRGEDEILNKGVVEARRSPGNQRGITNQLNPTTKGGPVTTTQFSQYGGGTGGVISQRTDDIESQRKGLGLNKNNQEINPYDIHGKENWLGEPVKQVSEAVIDYGTGGLYSKAKGAAKLGIAVGQGDLGTAAFEAAKGILNGDYNQTTYSKIGEALPAAR